MKTTLILLLAALSIPAKPEQYVTLAWNRNAESYVTGYKVYYGGASRHYTNSVDAGNETFKTITGLQDGVRYYFAATAYTASGVESDYSGEVSHANVSPVLSKFGDITTFSNQRIPPVSFTVSDKESLPISMIVKAYSSNTGVIQRSSLVLTGTGTNRMLHFSTNSTPFGHEGSTVVSVVLCDPWCCVTQKFNLNLIASPTTPKGLNKVTVTP